MDTNQYFFSIVIPAHNEESYLGETLQSIKALDYPKELFETVVVENGSSDKTLDIAKSHADEHIHVYTSEKGVSKAKNAGLDHASDQSDWVILLDADTALMPSFLSELNAYLQTKKAKNLAVGTAAVQPLEKSMRASLWFAFYNFGHWLTKTSFAIQIVKTSLRKDVRFDEHITFSEDLLFLRDARKYGSFFYFHTKAVLTSTRRFEKIGWTKLFIDWLRQSLFLSYDKRKHEQYKVIR